MDESGIRLGCGMPRRSCHDTATASQAEATAHSPYPGVDGLPRAQKIVRRISTQAGFLLDQGLCPY